LNKNEIFLGIDYGLRFTGLAIYRQGVDPFPLELGRLPYLNDHQLAQEIKQIVSENEITSILLGLPLFTDGKESRMTKKVRLFAETLASQCSPIPVHLHDETLSTEEAKERMKDSPKYNFKVDLEKIDQVCAVLLIESYLIK
jgi:putative Holliday junction resolvase